MNLPYLVRRTLFPLLAGTLAGLLLFGCGSEGCTLNLVAGLQVLIDDSKGGEGGEGGEGGLNCSTIEATAIDTADGSSEELRCYLRDLGCECAGLVERPGTYTVKVQAGDHTEQQPVTLESNGCHVVPQTLTFFEQATSE